MVITMSSAVTLMLKGKKRPSSTLVTKFVLEVTILKEMSPSDL